MSVGGAGREKEIIKDRKDDEGGGRVCVCIYRRRG